MFRGESGGSVGIGEALQGGEKPETFDQDPQKSEGFLIENGQTFHEIEGSVKIPGTSQSVHYVGCMPEDLKSPLLNIVVPGFGGIKGSYKRFAESMAAQEGAFTVSFAPARTSSRILDPQKIHKDTIGAVVNDIFDEKRLKDQPNESLVDVSRFNAITHSMGVIAGSRYALSNPDELAALLALNPIGFEPSGLPAKYLIRFGSCAGKEIIPGLIKNEFEGHRSIGSAITMGRHLLGNVVQTVGEVVTCHTSDLARTVYRVGEMSVKTGIIFTLDDGLVHAKPSLKVIDGLVDYHELVPGMDHFGPQKQPERMAGHTGRALVELA